MKRLPKSGNVTIKLGPAEVKSIIERPSSYLQTYGDKPKELAAKIHKAVLEKFSSVANDMDEELRARDICFGMRDSDAWKTLSGGFKAERQAMDAMDAALDKKKAGAMEKLVQGAFDEAGIVGFVASSYGFKKVVQDDTS